MFLSNLDSILSLSLKKIHPLYWLDHRIWCWLKMVRIDSIVLFLSLKRKVDYISLLTESSHRSRKIQSPLMETNWEYLKDNGCFFSQLKIVIKYSQLMIIVLKSNNGIIIFLWLFTVWEFHTHIMCFDELPPLPSHWILPILQNLPSSQAFIKPNVST